MQLRNDNALRAIDDERTVLRHQRDFAKKYVFFLNITHRHRFRVRVFIVNRQANLDLERYAVRHAPVLAFYLVMFVFQADGFAAVGTQIGPHLVKSSAMRTERFT